MREIYSNYEMQMSKDIHRYRFDLYLILLQFQLCYLFYTLIKRYLKYLIVYSYLWLLIRVLQYFNSWIRVCVL
jgi:hypothetical protein